MVAFSELRGSPILGLSEFRIKQTEGGSSCSSIGPFG